MGHRYRARHRRPDWHSPAGASGRDADRGRSGAGGVGEWLYEGRCGHARRDRRGIGAASYLVDFAAAALGAKKFGASPRAMLGAGLGTLAGLFLGPLGIIFGPFVGAIIGELTVHRDMAKVGKAGLAAWIGFLIGMAVKVGIAFVMIAIFLSALFVF